MINAIRLCLYWLAALLFILSWHGVSHAQNVRTIVTGPPVYIKALEVNLNEKNKVWRGRYGAGLTLVPNFPGGTNENAALELDFKLVWKDKVFFENGTLGVVALNRRLLRAGFLLRGEQGRTLRELPPALQGLDKVSDRLTGGFFAGFAFYKTYFTAEFLTDLSNVTNGQTFEVELGYTVELSRQARLVPYVGLKWGSRRHVDAFFGVNAAQSIATGLQQFSAPAGIYENTLGILLENDIGKNWHFNASADIALLTDGAGDSPITRSTFGDSEQITLRLKLLKTF